MCLRGLAHRKSPLCRFVKRSIGGNRGWTVEGRFQAKSKGSKIKIELRREQAMERSFNMFDNLETHSEKAKKKKGACSEQADSRIDHVRETR